MTDTPTLETAPTTAPPAPATALPQKTKAQIAAEEAAMHDPLRVQFAFEAFRILVKAQVDAGKVDDSQIKTWTWRYADAAMRGKKKIHRESLSQTGVVIGPPPEPTMPVPEILPPLDEIR